jgi:hypothetical protein
MNTKQFQVLAGVLIALGATVLVVGYAGIRQEADVALQLPYIVSGGLGGLFLLGAGVALFLGTSLADLRRGFDRLEGIVTELADDSLELSNEVRTLLDAAEVEPIPSNGQLTASSAAR